ncbi:transposon Ty3-G Gag-Pol polyprotein [Trichonephila clavipes]|nr:transposon Ty3-G Gag-Pol polyprotein [Trichonephila clavipes]
MFVEKIKLCVSILNKDGVCRQGKAMRRYPKQDGVCRQGKAMRRYPKQDGVCRQGKAMRRPPKRRLFLKTGGSENSLRVDELLSKLVSLEEQLASLKLQRKFGAQALITIRGVEVAANQGAATILRDDIASTISDSGRSASLDRETGCQFLVDSGADVSILPWTKTKGECQASQYKLYAANGTEIPTYGLKILTLDLGLRRPFQWPFIIAKVERGIIGADFLQKFQLLIDLHNRKLIDGVTNLSIKGEVATIQENNDLSTVNRASKYFNLLKLYPDLTKPNLVNRVVKHEVKHHILTTGQPVYSKARQLAPDKLKLAKQEFQFMLDNDIIRPSKSQWASPLHLVNKKDGTLRPCGDYRRLNAQTIPDRYPIPRIEDFNHILKDKKKIFSKIDLVKAYYQIPIAEEDKEKLPSPPHLACTSSIL